MKVSRKSYRSYVCEHCGYDTTDREWCLDHEKVCLEEQEEHKKQRNECLENLINFIKDNQAIMCLINHGFDEDAKRLITWIVDYTHDLGDMAYYYETVEEAIKSVRPKES